MVSGLVRRSVGCLLMVTIVLSIGGCSTGFLDDLRLKIAIDLYDPRVYWTLRSEGDLRSARPDGSEDVPVLGSLAEPTAIALDTEAQTLYWATASGTDGLIQRAEIDGSGPQTVVTITADHATGLAVDTVNDRIYWVQGSGNTIHRANLDGSGAATVVVSTGDLYDVAVDPAYGRFFWTESASPYRVRSARLDGTDPKDVIASMVSPLRGIAVDTEKGKLYWSDSGGNLWRSSRGAGSSDEVAIVTGLTAPKGVGLDLKAGRVYWVEWTIPPRLSWARLDGTGQEFLVQPTDSTPTDVIVDWPLQIPD